MDKNTRKTANNLKLKESTKFTILAIVLIAIFAFVLTPITLQNDTYYTIKIGEHIIQNGIDMQDPFSWHENLPYTYPHWLYDLLTYLIYSIFSFEGIYVTTAILSIILGITIFLVNKKINKNEVISFVVTIGAMYILKGYITARAQLVTFILFILIIYFIEQFLENTKKRYAIGLILISILIANLHVAVWPFIFILFLPYIAEDIIANIADIIIYRKLQMKVNQKRLQILLRRNSDKEKIERLQKYIEKEKIAIENIKRKREKCIENPYKLRILKNKNVKWLILIMIICAFTGLISPTGDTPYTYLYKTMQGDTPKNINEHLPMTLAQNENALCTILIFLAILIFTNAKIRLKDLFMLGGLIFLMLYSQRQISMLALIGSLILTRMLVEVTSNYFDSFNEKMLKILTTKVAMCIITAIILLISFTFMSDKKGDTIIDESSYPVLACDYILENLSLEGMRLYNDYNFGSYILYRGIPVFIDSRADLYAPEFNTLTGDPKDGQNIFMDFIETSQGSKYCEDTFKKYDITHILVPSDSKVNMAIKKSNSTIYEKLYSDEDFILYKRNVN